MKWGASLQAATVASRSSLTPALRAVLAPVDTRAASVDLTDPQMHQLKSGRRSWDETAPTAAAEHRAAGRAALPEPGQGV
ncbi:conserved hypothetical protein [Streptomyces sviceus ATCC 29083]|uniref:Uncharacterized protein n=1 Tax=Streptomyces sviceus (strain ATCC 29083 / DSM 924 / JCM 4929 / NBRC 13980 / NCIMB 11184 / NRRL 5439 / UC 5370) TaxID=463191 RepID=B5I7K6_STRX2|nr:conserved hypothetical protein [Streptomyces sviceus ATCC 29083]